MRVNDTLRRTEIGKMFISITKYLFTIVIIGAIIPEDIDFRLLTTGFVLAIPIGIIGYFVLPLTEEAES